MDQCGPTGGRLAVAYVDVTGPSATDGAGGAGANGNGTAGTGDHGAGADPLTRVVELITGHLRPSDLTVRIRVDEFLCVMADTSPPEMRQRFHAIVGALGGGPDAGAIRTGFAELGVHASPTDPDRPRTPGIARRRGERAARLPTPAPRPSN